MKVHLTTLGCPKNQVDSELMLGRLAAAGHPITEQAEDAECLIVNTCAFIDRAREESINTILELAKLKQRGACRALIVTGCLTQRYGAEILDEMPEVDGILGTSNLERIVELVGQAANRQDWASSAPPGYLYDAAAPRLLTARVPYAYVKIAEGCDMGCTFCAIPQFRGRHRSRPLGDIVAEVQGLAARGVQEAILVSQDTLAYGRDLPGNGDIGDLVLALGDDTRMPWIRPMYLHPAHVNDRLLDKWSRARIVPYVDMPVQHADDGILKAMRRGVTARRMKDVVAAFRDAIPGVTIRTTVLVGFPGETAAAFDNLLAFVEDVRFDRLGVFTYSPEAGTPSPSFADQVEPEVAAERAAVVQDRQDAISWEANAKLVGAVVDVLVDGPSEDPAFAWEGRMAGQAPEIDGVVYVRGRDAATPGRFARLRIAEVEGYELIAEVGGPEMAPDTSPALALFFLRPSRPALIVLILAVIVVGIWAAQDAERSLGGKDPGAIVIDEVAGMALSVVALPLTPAVLLAGFVLFRVFDIVKPYPANALQRLPGGVGVMIDDLVAGLYALLLLLAARVLVGWP